MIVIQYNIMELTKVERENKVYVNDKAIVLDKNTITASELLELAGFSSLAYNVYMILDRKRNKSKLLGENKKIKIETGMRFDAILKQG
jgi:Multiubiquitin